MSEKALFEAIDPSKSQFHKFSKIVRDIDTRTADDAFNYAVIAYWEKNSAKKLQVRQPFLIRNALSRVVNADHDLHEVVFTSENIALPFFFSKKPGEEQLILHILEEPIDVEALDKPGAPIPKSMSRKLSKMVTSKFSTGEIEPPGLKNFRIASGSFLAEQIQVYFENKEVSKRRDLTCFPMRAPTIIENKDKKKYLVIQNTLEKDLKMSLCFLEIPYSLFGILAKKLAGVFKAKGSAEVIDKVAFEVPGAEMFLGIDPDQEHIYFLTNRKLVNLANSVTDAIEARFSSPPIVKKISFAQMQELKVLQDKLKSTTNDESDESLREDSESMSEHEVNLDENKEKIRAIMEGLPCWDMVGDEQTIDFYRAFSMDYAYCEGFMHDKN